MVGTSNHSVPEMTINLMIHMGGDDEGSMKELGSWEFRAMGTCVFLVLIGLGLNGNIARIPIFDMSDYLL